MLFFPITNSYIDLQLVYNVNKQDKSLTTPQPIQVDELQGVNPSHELLKDHRVQRQAIPCEKATRRSQTERRCRRSSWRLRIRLLKVRLRRNLTPRQKHEVCSESWNCNQPASMPAYRFVIVSSWEDCSGEARARTCVATWIHDICFLTQFAAFDPVEPQHGERFLPGRKQLYRRPRTLLEFRHRPLGPMPATPRKHDAFDPASLSGCHLAAQHKSFVTT